MVMHRLVCIPTSLSPAAAGQPAPAAWPAVPGPGPAPGWCSPGPGTARCWSSLA